MKVLSIDIGIKNLAYSIFRIIENKGLLVDDVGIIDVSRNQTIDIKDMESLTKSLIDIAIDFLKEPLDYIVIENQPALKNPTMKTVQVVLYTTFIMKRNDQLKSIVLYSATNKLKVIKLLQNEIPQTILDIAKANNTYTNRKKTAIELCKWLVNCQKINFESMQTRQKFDMKNKQADICDTLLQGFHFASAL